MKRVLKALLELVFLLLALPVALPVRLSKPLDSRHAVFQLGSQAVSLLPGLPGVYFRRAYYRIVLGLRTRGFVVEFGTVLCQWGIEIGHFAYLGPYCNVGLSSIGDDVLLGSGVDIVSGPQVHHFDRLDVPIREQGGTYQKVRVGRDVWIGNKSVVMADIAEGTVVGAGSVVTRVFAPRSIIAGAPARFIRSREDEPTAPRDADESRLARPSAPASSAAPPPRSSPA